MQRTDPLCSACEEEEETPYHFLGKCSARMLDGMSAFGPYLLELEELCKVKLISLTALYEPIKGFSNLRLHQGCALGQNDMPSAWQLTTVHHEGKVRLLT